MRTVTNDDDDEVDTFVKIPENQPPASPTKNNVNFGYFMDKIDNTAQGVDNIDIENQSVS